MKRIRLIALVALFAASTFGLLKGEVPSVQSGTWAPAPAMSAPRGKAAAVLMPNGRVLIGWFAKKFHSLPAGILFGLAIGAFFAFLVAAMPTPEGKHYYWEIMLPGSILGLVVGYATQRYGRPSTT